MVVIFGFGPGRQKDLGEVAPGVCPNCHNRVLFHHVRSKKSVRLYFVPVVPYGTDDYLVCPICSRGLQLTSAQLPHVRSMSSTSASLRAGRITETQYLAETERFWQRLGVDLAGQQAPAPAAPGTSAGAQPVTPAATATPAQPQPGTAEDETSWVVQLRQLTQLHEQGLLSDADYEAAKRRLLHR